MTPGVTSSCPSKTVVTTPPLEVISTSYTYLPAANAFVCVAVKLIAIVPPVALDTEAEKAVLGGIMLRNETWDLISDLVKEDDFHQEEHRLIYRTINLLQDAGKPVDVITVQEAIEGNGDLPKLISSGGKDYLTLLAKETPSVANIQSYADIIKQRSNLRRLIVAADNISKVAKESDASGTDRIIDEAEEKILSLRDDLNRSVGPRIVKDLLGPVYADIQESAESGNSLVGVSTGFTRLDDLTLGFQKSDLIMLPPVPDPPAFRDFYAFEQHVKAARKLRGLEMNPDWYKICLLYTSPSPRDS